MWYIITFFPALSRDMYFDENRCLIRQCSLYVNESPIIISEYNSIHMLKIYRVELLLDQLSQVEKMHLHNMVIF